MKDRCYNHPSQNAAGSKMVQTTTGRAVYRLCADCLAGGTDQRPDFASEHRQGIEAMREYMTELTNTPRQRQRRGNR